ncbi:MAG TPA: hypothetical protein VNY05_07825 [Candidatus Acidoferrales bacterium]|jgi:hypothetical protein|nr:hypothetical protein [Candidatus Acidoferrales bacterium]
MPTDRYEMPADVLRPGWKGTDGPLVRAGTSVREPIGLFVQNEPPRKERESRMARVASGDKGMLRLLILAAALCGGIMANSDFDQTDFDQTQAARFAALALDCVHKPYPNKIPIR